MTETLENEGAMANDKDIETLHKRIDKLTSKFEKCNGEVVDKLNVIYTAVEVIKKTCETRGKTCARHVTELDTMVRGNGKKGILTRLEKLETTTTSKEKFAFLIIGAAVTGCVSLILTLLFKS